MKGRAESFTGVSFPSEVSLPFLSYSPEEQLAPSAFLLPCSALLFPGHLHGDPPRVSEDSVHHVLPLDV